MSGVTRVAFLMPAGPNETWTDQAAQGLVGKLTTLRTADWATALVPPGPVIVEGAEVRENGRALWLTVRTVGRDS